MVLVNSQLFNNKLCSFSNWNNDLTYMIAYLPISKAVSVEDLRTRLSLLNLIVKSENEPLKSISSIEEDRKPLVFL